MLNKIFSIQSTRLILKLVTVLICGYIPFCYALKTDSEKPIQIVADHATFDQKNMVSVFTGNVVITQGSLTAHAANAKASQDSNGYQNITLMGNPVTFSQLNDDGEMTQGQGNNFDYNSKNNLAVLTGRARVKKGDNIVMGDKITYNTQSQIFSATSTNANGVSTTKSGRVTVILQPDQKGQNGKKSIFDTK